MTSSAAALASAYAACERDASTHYENFPVASFLLPRRMRRHVAAVYAFARAADDFADEGERPVAERHALLDGWLSRLHRAAAAETPGPSPGAGEPKNTVEIFVALGATIRAHRLPVSLLEHLVSAFRQDIETTRYAHWEDLFDYCRRSANPVGRLVLRIAGHHDAELDAASDAVCTALQLTNFWQDVKIDVDRGRIYLPAAERAIYGAREQDLLDGRITDAWRGALASATARTRELFEAGRPVCDLRSTSPDAVAGRLRFELRATWLGGMRVLDRLEQSGYDPVHARPKLGLRDAPWFAWRLASWRTADQAGATRKADAARWRRAR